MSILTVFGCLLVGEMFLINIAYSKHLKEIHMHDQSITSNLESLIVNKNIIKRAEPSNLEPLEQSKNLTSESEPKTKKKDLDQDIKNTSISSSTPSIISKVQNNATNQTNKTIEKQPNYSHKKDDDFGPQKRGIIVFGVIGVIVCLYLCYVVKKRRKLFRNNNLSFDGGDQQFKYGILNYNDHSDNLEMSNIPLTADSDEDELEIFDLENKKRLENENINVSDVNDDLLGKDDVEILDLELPGVRNSSVAQGNSSVDDDLLNLDDAIDEILNKPVISTNSPKNDIKSNKDMFFNNL